MLLAKSMLNSIEVLISRGLMDSYFNHYEFVLVNNVLREYNNIDLNNSSKVLIYL